MVSNVNGRSGGSPTAVSYMPDGRPAPNLLTMEEAALYLRLDDRDRDIRDAVLSLERLVKQGHVRATKGLGKRRKFALAELNRVIEEATYGDELPDEPATSP